MTGRPGLPSGRRTRLRATSCILYLLYRLWSTNS